MSYRPDDSLEDDEVTDPNGFRHPVWPSVLVLVVIGVALSVVLVIATQAA